MKKNTLTIDGITIQDIAHFVKKGKKDAVAAMVADGFCPGDNDKAKSQWAEKAFDQIKAEYDKPEGEEAKAEAPAGPAAPVVENQ